MPKANKRLSSREFILGLFTLLVIAFAYAKYWYAGTQASIRDWDQKILAMQQEISKNQILSAELQQRKTASVETFKSDVNLDDHVKNSDRFARVVQGLASGGPGLTTKTLQLLKAEEEKEFTKFTLLVELEGSFPEIGSFIERFETAPLLGEITSLEVSKIQPDLKKCLAKLQITSYVLPESQHD